MMPLSRSTQVSWRHSSFQNTLWVSNVIWRLSNRPGCQASCEQQDRTGHYADNPRCWTVDALLFLEALLEDSQVAGVDRYAVGVVLFCDILPGQILETSRSIASILIDEGASEQGGEHWLPGDALSVPQDAGYGQPPRLPSAPGGPTEGFWDRLRGERPSSRLARRSVWTWASGILIVH